MGAADEYVEDNFIRATHHLNRARVLASRLGPVLHDRYPHLFPSCPNVTAVMNQGWMNFTMLVKGAEHDPAYVVRLRPRKTLQEIASKSAPQFEKERFVLGQLRGVVPVPEVPEGGSGVLTVRLGGDEQAEFGFLMQTYLPFEPAGRDLGKDDRAGCFQQLGSILRRVHSVAASGFGTEFDEAHGAFSCGRWTEVIERRCAEIENGEVDARFKRFILARLQRLAALSPDPTLYHQDLLSNWGNFLVDEGRVIRGVVDWEFSGSGLAFHSELSSFVYARTRDGEDPDKTNQDLRSVCEGYGISFREYQQHYEYDVETLVLLHAVGALQKFMNLRKSGGLEREPWRATFAERARRLCERRVGEV